MNNRNRIIKQPYVGVMMLDENNKPHIIYGYFQKWHREKEDEDSLEDFYLTIKDEDGYEVVIPSVMIIQIALMIPKSEKAKAIAKQQEQEKPGENENGGVGKA